MRYRVEQIIAKLRDAEKLQGQGLTIPATCKRLGISDQTFYRWRIKYGALKEDEAQRLKALEQENARLTRIVAEQAVDISMLKELHWGNGEPGAPARRDRLPAGPTPSVGAPGLPPAGTASFHPTLSAGASGGGGPAGAPHELAGRRPSALWLPPNLGVAAG
jgi:transposase-like protein